MHDLQRLAGVIALAMRVIERGQHVLRDEGADVERHLEVVLGPAAEDLVT
jgi:hypothetical protein